MYAQLEKPKKLPTEKTELQQHGLGDAKRNHQADYDKVTEVLGP